MCFLRNGNMRLIYRKFFISLHTDFLKHFFFMLPKYNRVLLKLSGESLMGDRNFGIAPNMLEQYAQEIKSITDIGVQVAVVIGGGNIYRGMNEAETGIERAQ